MRIISPHFHDYYDSAISLGHDDRVIYHRDPIEIATGKGINDPAVKAHHWMRPKLQLQPQPIKIKNHGEISVEEVSIFFCGKLYTGVRVTHAESVYSVAKRDTFYTEESLTKFLGKFGLELESIYRSHRRQTKAYMSRWLPFSDTPHEIGETSSDALTKRAIDGKIVALSFVNHGYYFQQYTIIKNPRLSDFDFYRVKDAYQAFQEIDMFLSGVLAPENRPMVVIDDRYKRDEHGFDKWSFKKLPTKKR